MINRLWLSIRDLSFSPESSDVSVGAPCRDEAKDSDQTVHGGKPVETLRWIATMRAATLIAKCSADQTGDERVSRKDRKGE